MHSVEILWGKNHSLSQFDIDSLYRPALHSTANTGPSTVHKTAFLCIGIDKYIAAPTKTNKTTSGVQIVPNGCIWFLQAQSGCQISSPWCRRTSHGHYERRLELKTQSKQPVVCRRLGFAEQCALMCFIGLTADSDEGIEAVCHFVVEKKKSLASRLGERILFRSLQTCLLFLWLLITFGFHPAIPPSLPASLPLLHTVVW